MTRNRTLKNSEPLRVCLISYRSNPHSGGQGVYLKNLARGLMALGHHVEVVAGPPDPLLGSQVTVHRVVGLDLYNPEHPFRIPALRELVHPVNLMEWVGVSTMGFPEPFTFGLRATAFLNRHPGRFDIVHDNQSLSYGIWRLGRRMPVVATIHHPITVDRDIAVRSADTAWEKIKIRRWYSFLSMQRRVASRLARIITVSEAARVDICRAFNISTGRCSVVENGVDTRLFHPMPEVPREPGRLIVTNSAEMPLKGLGYLLEAVAFVSRTRPVRLVVVGSPKKDGEVFGLVQRLGIESRVHFTGRIDHERFRMEYARAAMAVIPSVYEGFGLPAAEAMACAVPVISTSGGALPEVVGDAGILVPPRDSEALSKAIGLLVDRPPLAAALGQAGYERVLKRFTWEETARKTAALYRQVIDAHRGL